ncbi:hypothetical protein R3Q17_37425 [Rhodococcus opacus]|nr:hypothetical protein [Rhodococcus opacus]
MERLDARRSRSGGLEGCEQVRQGAADRGVGVEDDVVGGVVDQADQERHDQLAAASLGQLPAAQPGLDEMQFGFLCGPHRCADRFGGLVVASVLGFGYSA